MGTYLTNILGRDGLHRSRLHDEKGHLVGPFAAAGVVAAGVFGVTQKISDRPYLPWVPFAVIRRMRTILSPSARVLEFGSGRSTRWFAAHASDVISIEDDPGWYSKMIAVFDAAGIRNVDYRLRGGAAYYDLKDVTGYFELIVVDGKFRHECVRAASGLVRQGGFLYLDNSDKDVTIPNGDIRQAEDALKQLAAAWASEVQYFVGFPPANFFPHEGALLRRNNGSTVA